MHACERSLMVSAARCSTFRGDTGTTCGRSSLPFPSASGGAERMLQQPQHVCTLRTRALSFLSWQDTRACGCIQQVCVPHHDVQKFIKVFTQARSPQHRFRVSHPHHPPPLRRRQNATPPRTARAESAAEAAVRDMGAWARSRKCNTQENTKSSRKA